MKVRKELQRNKKKRKNKMRGKKKAPLVKRITQRKRKEKW